MLAPSTEIYSQEYIYRTCWCWTICTSEGAPVERRILVNDKEMKKIHQKILTSLAN